ncbi:YueI family protein [Bacillus pinisoli]|uniref:YueI family protein n=1 Tax=Bacillus pinisoli TaxID=2901866 RepID=UPI001FF2474F|nr:YueI family protein [Bacillus pinisoli]
MAQKPSIDEYLQQGIYGTKEIKPEERNKFLGTLRERVVVVLTQPQVREPGTYKEVEDLIKEHTKATLYLNGNMDYKYLSDYMSLSSKYGTNYSIVTNKKINTELGLVLAYDYAVEKENIYITQNDDRASDKQEQNLFSKFFKNLFS